MTTTSLVISEGPRVKYSDLMERITPYLHNRVPEDLVFDVVRDAVIQVCRDLDFLRTTFEFDKNEERYDTRYTMVHQGYSFGNPLLAWHEKREPQNLLPPAVYDNIEIDLNQTIIEVPQYLHEVIRKKLFFMISFSPNRNSEDFPAAVYDQEAQLLIMRARTLLREFDQHPIPEQAYREKLSRAYTRYISTLGNDSVGMYI